MDELLKDIDRVVDLLNVFKSRYFFLRSKYDVELNSSSSVKSPENIQTEYKYASNDLQSFIMLELHLLEYACTYGIYSMTMYATRLKTNLKENENDPQFLKLLKCKVRDLMETNEEITNLSINSYSSFDSYINSFNVYNSVLNEINISSTVIEEESGVKKKKDKLMKKISKINLMANIITFLVYNKIKDYRTDSGRAALNMALKYRTPRSLEYYTNKLNQVN